MGKSPSHSLGQFIGYLQEKSLQPILQEVANDYGLYLDVMGPRPTRGKKRKLTWLDSDENKHDLDFVLERGGSSSTVGSPAAFIESAWRRYPRHSINKAAEIANALIPLTNTYKSEGPFMGAIVSGVWTPGGRARMTSQGIKILYIEIDEIVAAFQTKGIDVYYDEDTPEAELKDKVAACQALSDTDKSHLATELVQQNGTEYEGFRNSLILHLTRTVASVMVLPLHGSSKTFSSVGEATQMLRSYVPPEIREPLHRINIVVEYSNGSEVKASLTSTVEAVDWLLKLV